MKSYSEIIKEEIEKTAAEFETAKEQAIHDLENVTITGVGFGGIENVTRDLVRIADKYVALKNIYRD